MNDSTRPADAGSIAAMRSRVRADWRLIGAIAAVAIIARLAFFSGGRGSDEVMYLTQALKLLSGDWGHSTYIGEIRYGITFALALSIRVFGHGAPGAAGVIFLCSIGEVVLAFWFANRLWGRQAAIWSGLALATLPMGVYLPGSMLPDPYLGFVIELSIVTFYFAQRDNDGRLFFLARLLAAWVFCGVGVCRRCFFREQHLSGRLSPCLGCLA
jgi:4-amino-4-deoxy-L-arabinose transferase-like glycosyltransferase